MLDHLSMTERAALDFSVLCPAPLLEAEAVIWEMLGMLECGRVHESSHMKHYSLQCLRLTDTIYLRDFSISPYWTERILSDEQGARELKRIMEMCLNEG